ncbi:hypothetical protein [Cellulomonas sp. P24]|uniref:hypothetical protein n=1 Tax=Cellulomonas sp. P24 TaxID=2885206 RepID=UPI00216B2DF4|nr:hypothetical protein [Cellulomonas sp. P24]MCR6491115.1 hypothetical protein [Cellulomonas sp. P24]
MSTTTTLTGRSDRVARRAPFLNQRIMVIELRRVLRNRRTLIFTLVFLVAMFFFISASIPSDGQSLGAGVRANVSA